MPVRVCESVCVLEEDHFLASTYFTVGSSYRLLSAPLFLWLWYCYYDVKALTTLVEESTITSSSSLKHV